MSGTQDERASDAESELFRRLFGPQLLPSKGLADLPLTIKDADMAIRYLQSSVSSDRSLSAASRDKGFLARAKTRLTAPAPSPGNGNQAPQAAAPLPVPVAAPKPSPAPIPGNGKAEPHTAAPTATTASPKLGLTSGEQKEMVAQLELRMRKHNTSLEAAGREALTSIFGEIRAEHPHLKAACDFLEP